MKYKKDCDTEKFTASRYAEEFRDTAGPLTFVDLRALLLLARTFVLLVESRLPCEQLDRSHVLDDFYRELPRFVLLHKLQVPLHCGQGQSNLKPYQNQHHARPHQRHLKGYFLVVRYLPTVDEANDGINGNADDGVDDLEHA